MKASFLLALGLTWVGVTVATPCKPATPSSSSPAVSSPSASPSPSAGPNVVSNGDFSDGTNGWHVDYPALATTDGCTDGADPCVIFSANAFPGTAAGSNALYQLVPTTHGVTYTLSFQYYILLNGDSTGEFDVLINLAIFDQIFPLTVVGQWVTFSKQFASPNDGTFLEFTLQTSSTSPVSLELAEVAVEEQL